ncbi:hypothetical protein ACN27F_22170 [Solwaraspora sp. WMMB335]|uniref:hypothetical protein n=1 Tax=Solwaraspora sp. WMMB335 TaxID=3404118 RepID=UPI003B953BD5
MGQIPSQHGAAGAEPVAVRPAALLTAAHRLAGLGHQLGHGLAGAGELVVEAPGWTSAAALVEVEVAVHRQLCGSGALAATAGRALRTTATGYQDADQRAVRRLFR